MRHAQGHLVDNSAHGVVDLEAPQCSYLQQYSAFYCLPRRRRVDGMRQGRVVLDGGNEKPSTLTLFSHALAD
jgi:hypothetical protein